MEMESGQLGFSRRDDGLYVARNTCGFPFLLQVLVGERDRRTILRELRVDDAVPQVTFTVRDPAIGGGWRVDPWVQVPVDGEVLVMFDGESFRYLSAFGQLEGHAP